MTKHERKLLTRTIELGMVLTLFVILLDGLGILDPLERYCYDYRARDCQFFTPPPTDRIVHLDIDDPSLDEIGRWPWDREKVARIVDELHLAGTKLISLDILFAEPQEVRIEKVKDGADRVIEDDTDLAKSISQAGNVLLPVSVNIESESSSPLKTAVYKELFADLELGQVEIVNKLRGGPLDNKLLARQVADAFLSARQAAAFDRINELLSKQDLSMDEVCGRLLPKAAAEARRGDAQLVLEKLYYKVKSVRLVTAHTMPVPEGLPAILSAEKEVAITIPSLTEAAAYSTTPEFIPDDGGTVRRVPLFVNYRGRLFPHSALLTACAQLGVDPSQIRCLADKVILPLPNGEEIRIPVHTYNSKRFGPVGLLMNIPWFGTREWETMYDTVNHVDSAQHIPVKLVWTICQYQQDIKANERAADQALLSATATFPSAKASAFIAKSTTQRTNEERWPAINESLSELESLMDPKLLTAKPETLNKDEREFLAAYRALKQVKTTNDGRIEQIAQARSQLKQRLSGRTVIMGLTATGALDQYSTSLHAKCPGVVVLGVVFNGIMTRELWAVAPWWITAVITFLIGWLVTIAVAYLEPKQAMVCTVGIMLAYFVINGIVFFDWKNIILGVAAPLTTAFLVWSTLTLVRVISSEANRRRITNRFRSYVDPELVTYVMEHVDTARFEGQVKTMTVVFTDLAGFTTISERLRERTVPLLNRYMSLMLPIIRQNRGLWNKFLGDGIMFFFNAPRDNPNHARDAVRSVLQMQQALIGFNEELAKQDLPKVSMRAGVSSGPMIVGDAGSDDPQHGASDYTVLGDEVNLGARLESANKALGSKILLNEAAAKSCGDEFLLRPMGNICVVGKTEGVMTYEALCLLADATEEQKRLACLSKDVVESFQTSEFARCLESARQLEEEFGESKFTKLYLNLAEVYLIEPPGDKFDGQIVLSEK